MSNAIMHVRIRTPDGFISTYERLVPLDPKTETLEDRMVLQAHVADVAHFMRKCLVDGRRGDDV